MVLTFSDSEEHIFNKVVTALSGEQGIEYVSVLSNTVLAFHHLEIRLKEQTVYLDHILMPMTYHEFFTLAYLAQHPGWVFSKEQIYNAVWKESGDGGRQLRV